MDYLYQIVELTQNNSTLKNFDIPPDERTMGIIKKEEEDSDVIETDNIQIKIGNRPLAYNLGKIFKTKGKTIPKNLQMYDSYNVWLIEHNIGVLQTGGWDKITHIGYEMKFDDSLTDIKVLKVLPNTEFIQKFKGSLVFSAHIGIDALLKTPGDIVDFIDEIDFGIKNDFKIKTSASVVCNLTFTINTSIIQSLGVGSNNSRWQFTKLDQPLYGDDIKMYQIVLVEKDTDIVKFQARVSSIISIWNCIPSERTGKWLPLECNLINQ